MVNKLNAQNQDMSANLTSKKRSKTERSAKLSEFGSIDTDTMAKAKQTKINKSTDNQEKERNEKIKAQRRKTYIQMISQQKGFLFAIFASSLVLSAIFILSFVAFIFKLGFTKPNPFLVNNNFSIYNFESQINATL